MTGRSLALTLAAWSCGLATPCLAQGYGSGPAYGPAYSSPGGVVTMPPEAGGYGYSMGAFGDDPSMASVSPAGYSISGEYCPPAEDPEPWWKRRPRLDRRLLAPPRNSFVRLEYLLWEIEDPGSEYLGARFPSEPGLGRDLDFDDDIFDTDFDPSQGFFVRDFETNTLGVVYVPRIDQISLRDNSGLRLTFGIPTYEYGTIELSGWVLEQASDHYEYGPKPDSFFFFAPNPAISFNTEEHGRMLSVGFDQIDTVYTSDMFGADANFVIDSLSPPGEGFKLRPVVGVKYLSLQEYQSVNGHSDAPFSQGRDFSLTSDVTNNFIGGTIGLRTELVHRWFTVGLQPSATLGGNIAEGTVRTAPFFSVNDGAHNTESYFSFAPILDLKAYARVCLTENLRLTVGYDAFWLAHAYRASDIIDYRIDTDGGTSLRSASRVKRQTDDVAVEGLSVGLEYVF